MYNQAVNASALGDHLPDYIDQDRGQAPGPVGPQPLDGQIQIFVQQLAVQEEQSAKGLTLALLSTADSVSKQPRFPLLSVR